MKNQLSQRSQHQGFSLVEMLTVVAVIGVLAGIALPSLNATSASREVQHQRNAKSLISMAVGADIAGVSLIVTGDLDATVNRIMTGAAPTQGAFKDHIFRLHGLTAEAAEGAKKYLKVEGERLVFVPANATENVSN